MVCDDIILNIKSVFGHAKRTHWENKSKGDQKMIKVGIIGAGRIGRVHITSITTRVPVEAYSPVSSNTLFSNKSFTFANTVGILKFNSFAIPALDVT